MQLRYKETGEIHTFSYPVDARQAWDTGRYETIDGKSPVAAMPSKKESTEEVTEIEKPTPRIRRKPRTEEEVATNEN
jgi:hypothetical protein